MSSTSENRGFVASVAQLEYGIAVLPASITLGGAMGIAGYGIYNTEATSPMYAHLGAEIQADQVKITDTQTALDVTRQQPQVVDTLQGEMAAYKKEITTMTAQQVSYGHPSEAIEAGIAVPPLVLLPALAYASIRLARRSVARSRANAAKERAAAFSS